MEKTIPILLVLFLALMFFAFRKQKRTNQAHEELVSLVKPGVEIQTTSGLYGTVRGVAGDTIDLEISPGIVTRWNKLVVREIFDKAVLADNELPDVETKEAVNNDESTK